MASRTHITRRQFLASAAAAAALSCTAPATQGADSSGPPHVLFIVVDTLRADRLTARREGIRLMPNLSALAGRAWWFTQCLAQASWTKPAMASIFTSLYAGTHHVHFGVHEEKGSGAAMDLLPPTLPAMASYFRRAGYATAGIQANANIAADSGFKQGFDVYDAEAVYPERRADTITDLAMAQLASAKKPLFLYLHYMDPHAPYGPPPPFREPFGPPPELGPSDRALVDDYFGFYNDLVMTEVGLKPDRTHADLSEAGREYIRYLYDADVHFADRELGRLLDHVAAHYPHTAVVVTADHGEELWDHGTVGHGRTVYQEVVHVPWVLHWPGADARRIEAGVESVDILPTVAARLGWDPAPHWQGRAHTPETLASAPATPPRYAQTRSSIKRTGIHVRAVVDGHNKLIVPAGAAPELYDLAADPGETTNRAATAADAADRLRGLLDAHDAANEAHPLFQSESTTANPDAARIEAIRSQGYL